VKTTRIPNPRHLLAPLLAAFVALAPAVPARGAANFYVRGAGYGHGVGMSQYGAYGYALHGEDYRFILAHYYTGTSLGSVDPSRTVTVLLATGGAAFSGASRAGDKKLDPATTYEVHALANGQLSLGAHSGRLAGHFDAPLKVTGPGPLTVPRLGPYRGSLEFLPDGSGRVETINAVGLDDYVRGVVAAEMPSGWSMQALEAQAVAARTYAITTDSGGSAYNQYADTRSQVYDGVRAETPRSDAAVAATRGQVVTYGGDPAVTYFFSSSGGHTENNENAFLGSTPEPWLRGVPDPYDAAGANPDHRWRVELTAGRAASKLGRLVEGTFVGISAIVHGVSPRIITADVVGSAGSRTVTGPELEQRLGLISTWATFTTITTVAGAPGSGAGAEGGGGGAVVAEKTMLASLVGALLAHAAASPNLAGTVFPAARGARIAVQRRQNGSWRTIVHARLAGGGGYAVHLTRRGVYRIVYEGLDGPAVTF